MIPTALSTHPICPIFANLSTIGLIAAFFTMFPLNELDNLISYLYTYQ
ncbi:hypothetical protein PG2022B_1851 [Bifidobacterium animalis subsp. animalis]|nr:hypothetical protein PG2022B_1851 [Bifidobacterium animalis subsp. animalis]